MKKTATMTDSQILDKFSPAKGIFLLEIIKLARAEGIKQGIAQERKKVLKPKKRKWKRTDPYHIMGVK